MKIEFVMMPQAEGPTLNLVEGTGMYLAYDRMTESKVLILAHGEYGIVAHLDPLMLEEFVRLLQRPTANINPDQFQFGFLVDE
jgi:hypothetical protein